MYDPNMPPVPPDMMQIMTMGAPVPGVPTTKASPFPPVGPVQLNSFTPGAAPAIPQFGQHPARAMGDQIRAWAQSRGTFASPQEWLAAMPAIGGFGGFGGGFPGFGQAPAAPSAPAATPLPAPTTPQQSATSGVPGNFTMPGHATLTNPVSAQQPLNGQMKQRKTGGFFAGRGR